MTPQIDVPEVIPATLDDLEEIASFNGRIHEDEKVKPTVVDLIHFNKIPDIQRGFLLARNPENGEVISSCCLIPQNLRYGNIPIQAGNPEFVGTDAAFRRKGLISRQFEIMHQWSEENGDDLQFIGGIPYFYRKYGYEMTVTMANRRSDHPSVLDEIKAPEKEVNFEEASENNIPDLIRLFGQENQTYLVTGDWSKQDWLYRFGDQKNDGCASELIFILRRKNGTVIGAVRFNNAPEEKLFCLLAAVIDTNLATWDEVENAILIKLKSLAEERAQYSGKTYTEIGMKLPSTHPLMVRCGYLFKHEYKGYAWYVRVPDWVRFLNKVKTVLEENIHQSPYRGLTRTININLYTSGIQIEFGKGVIKSLKAWVPPSIEDGDFKCPESAFTHLVMGHRTVEEIQHLYRDCYGKKDTASLMNYCFPKKESYLCPVL